MADASIKAVITAKDEASNVLKAFGNSASSVGDKIASVAKTAAVGLAAAGAAAIGFGVVSVKAYSESEDVLAQLNATLQSTANAAGWTADAAVKLSKELQKETKFSDEAVLSVENLLLTFTAIGKNIMPRATETVLDMATALGEDTKSASIQLGKALQDPILGITALRRVGVNFTDAQKKVIERLVETGQKAKAQELILKELHTEFGGSAEAAGGTFAGSLAKLKNSLNDVQESLGLTIVKYLTPFVAKASEFISSIDWEAVINRSIEAIKRLVSVLSNIKDSIVNTYQAVVNYITPGFEKFMNTMRLVGKVLSEAVGPSFNALVETIRDRLLPQIIAIWSAIEPGFTGALQVLATGLGVIIVAAIWVFINALNVTLSVLGFVIRAINDVINWLGNLAGVIINVFKGIPGFISSAFGGLVDIITQPFRTAFDIIINGVEGVKRSINSIKGGAANSVQNVLDPLHLLHRAGGGPVSAGTPYMVGEQGQEMFVPQEAGTIVPNNKLSGGSSPVVNVTFNGVFTGSQVEFRKLAKQVFEAHADAMSMGTV